jgi:hypothetical protein
MENFLMDLFELLNDVHQMEESAIGEAVQDAMGENDITRFEVTKIDSSTVAIFDGTKRVSITIK